MTEKDLATAEMVRRDPVGYMLFGDMDKAIPST